MNKSYFSKLILTLIVVLLGSLFPQNVSANQDVKESYTIEGINYEKTEKDGIVIVTESKDGNLLNTYSYDTATTDMKIVDNEGATIDQYNLEEVAAEIEYESLNESKSASSGYTTMATTKTLKSRFSPWEYRKTGSRWRVTIVDRTKKIKYRTYNSKTSGHLIGFKNAIEDIRDAELAVISALGYNMAANAIAGLITGGLGTFIAVVSGGVAAVQAGNLIIKAMNRGKTHFYSL